MKKIISLIFAIALTLTVAAQNTFDGVFEKYKGKSGFTTLSMGNELLKFAAALDPNDEELQQLPDKIRGIRLLVSENGGKKLSDEFTEAVKAEDYLDIMEVVDEGAVVNFYAKPAEDNFCGFAMVVSNSNGMGEVVLLSIDGTFTRDDLVELGKTNGNGYLSVLRKLENGK